MADLTNAREFFGFCGAFLPSGRLGEDETPCSWSDFSGPAMLRTMPEDPKHVWYVPSETSGGDYSGPCLHKRVNADAIIRIRDEQDVDGVVEISGAHGEFGIAIRGDVSNREILECYAALADHPVLDEELLSEVEVEKQDDVWEKWARLAFVSALETKFDVELRDDVSDEILREVFFDSEALQWKNIEGVHLTCDIDKVVADVEIHQIRSYLPLNRLKVLAAGRTHLASKEASWLREQFDEDELCEECGGSCFSHRIVLLLPDPTTWTDESRQQPYDFKPGVSMFFICRTEVDAFTPDKSENAQDEVEPRTFEDGYGWAQFRLTSLLAPGFEDYGSGPMTLDFLRGIREAMGKAMEQVDAAMIELQQREPAKVCAECGEHWPCSMYENRHRYNPLTSASHRPITKDEAQQKLLDEVDALTLTADKMTPREGPDGELRRKVTAEIVSRTTDGTVKRFKGEGQ